MLVPSSRLAELRLTMAAAGIPKNGRIGFELFDKTNFGMTDFAEHVNYRRALEGELERSVMSLTEVEQARVHLTFPKDSVFLEAQQPAKASVLLRLKPGARLAPANVLAIDHLLASAVEGLSPDAVSVLDMNGNLLAEAPPEPARRPRGLRGGARLPAAGRIAAPGQNQRRPDPASGRRQVPCRSIGGRRRPDTSGVPYEESVGTLGELLDEGKIAMAGISNANPEQIRLAQEVLGGRLVSVQNQYSPAYRSSEPELRLCTEMGIAFLPWSPLGGMSKASELGSSFAPFQEVADARGVSPQQVTLAWMLATSPVVIPIPGSSRPETARDSAAAAGLELSAEEMQRLDAAV